MNQEEIDALSDAVEVDVIIVFSEDKLLLYIDHPEPFALGDKITITITPHSSVGGGVSVTVEFVVDAMGSPRLLALLSAVSATLIKYDSCSTKAWMYQVGR
jgi:hypothetical protein